jgi:type I restriction enzyme S subunit
MIRKSCDANFINDLPKGWVSTNLVEITKFTKGKKPKNLSEKNNIFLYPYINIEAFEKKCFNQYSDNDNYPLCSSDDILIVWDGARCGLVGTGVSGIIGSTLAKLDCFEIEKSFLFYFLQSKYHLLNKRPKGVGIPHVDPTIFNEIKIAIPPKNEQQRIVEKIEELFTKLDAGVAALEKVKAQLKRYRQAVLKAAFSGQLTADWRKKHSDGVGAGSSRPSESFAQKSQDGMVSGGAIATLQNSDFSEFPKGWEKITIDGVSKRIQYGTSSKSIFDPNGIPVLRMGNIQDFKLSFEKLKHFPFNWNETDKYLLKDGDVLFNRTNSAELVGKTAVYKAKYPKAIFASYLIRIELDQEKYDPNFLSYYMNSIFGKRYVTSVVSQQVGQANVNGSKLTAMPIPFLQLEEQHQIVSEIERRFSVADQVEKTVDNALKQAQRLRQSILKRAFEGKLVPQDPNDEPAEKLLERIKAEKAKLAETKKSRQKK